MAKYIGLDIEDNEIYMAKNGDTVYMQMPENLLKDNKVISPESLSKFIKSVKKEGSIGGNGIALVLPDDSTFFRNVTSPVVSDAQLKLNLPYEFRDFVGSNSIEYNYDYVVTSYDKDENDNVSGINILAAAANKKVVEEYYNIIKRAGLKLKVALPHEMALINIMKNADENKEYCLINIAYDHCNVYIFNGNKLTATKMIDIGCKDIDLAIAANLNIDLYLAASYRNTNHNNVLESEYLNNIYENIALEVMKTINFYRYENQETNLSEVYFFGTGCRLNTLKKNICGNVQFTEEDIKNILPDEYKNDENADRCLLSVGVTL